MKINRKVTVKWAVEYVGHSGVSDTAWYTRIRIHKSVSIHSKLEYIFSGFLVHCLIWYKRHVVYGVIFSIMSSAIIVICSSLCMFSQICIYSNVFAFQKSQTSSGPPPASFHILYNYPIK